MGIPPSEPATKPVLALVYDKRLSHSHMVESQARVSGGFAQRLQKQICWSRSPQPRFICTA